MTVSKRWVRADIRSGWVETKSFSTQLSLTLHCTAQINSSLHTLFGWTQLDSCGFLRFWGVFAVTSHRTTLVWLSSWSFLNTLKNLSFSTQYMTLVLLILPILKITYLIVARRYTCYYSGNQKICFLKSRLLTYHIFLRTKLFLLFKIESLNFQHFIDVGFHESSQNFSSIGHLLFFKFN